MKNTIDQWEKEINSVLKVLGRNPRVLCLNVHVLAVSFYRLFLAVEETAQFDRVSVENINGAIQQHPAFKMQIDTENSILRQLKELGLTADDTTESDQEADRLFELMHTIAPKSTNRRKVKPD